MRLTTRFIALGLAGAVLAGCGHKDKDAPLAFVPADTPYVVANLEVLDDATRSAMLAQADAQLPSQLAQLTSAATDMTTKDPAGERLMHAFAGEFGPAGQQRIETFAKNSGMDLQGHVAMYGLGLSPIIRFELADPKAFDAFIGRMETAYGEKLPMVKIGEQSYRAYALPNSGAEMILAQVGKQGVAALLPADASPALLREALGVDRPKDSLLDDGRLAKLAKAKGYKDWLVGDFDLTRVLPLALGGSDPLVAAMRKARAEAESAKTGEPVASQLKITPACATDAARIAARVPMLSFGYTRLNAKHQDVRADVALAGDITQAFDGLKLDLPGLGTAGTAAFDLSIALPVAQLRSFWAAQADAVAAKPFTCPALASLNDAFAKLGPATQKAAIPPFGDLLGVRIALDTLTTNPNSSVPGFTGRLVMATNNPTGLLAMGQMMVPALAQVKATADAKPEALPPNITQLLGQPGWVAMGSKALALGIGTAEESKLADTLKEAGGGAGQLARVHLSGGMYVNWLQLMEKKMDDLNAAVGAMGTTPDASGDAAQKAARSKAQFAAMEAQAQRVDTIDGEVHMDSAGVVITSQTVLK